MTIYNENEIDQIYNVIDSIDRLILPTKGVDPVTHTGATTQQTELPHQHVYFT
jgi:hypothetical protein